MKRTYILIIILILLVLFAESILGLMGAIDKGTPFSYYAPYPLGYQGSPAQRLGIPYQKWEGLAKIRFNQ